MAGSGHLVLCLLVIGVALVSRGGMPMRAIPITAITFAGLFLSSIGAHADGTWCAQYSGRGGATNCGFYSFDQCQAARSGNGGFL